jgi:hypothetical protein
MSNPKSGIPIGIGREFDAKNMDGHKAFLKSRYQSENPIYLYIYICYSKNVIGDKKKK